ncbi:M16 family metallopeptidase [Candidatus Odyssella acanthamoebae]|uniref:M16 family metallopeptidase n=1 Tax=Candidatus Odyssella acanthamoebae TaxID=91604 RepID=UPI000691B5B2|nr:pitrilysin family protein [Candidatus Paracaedibacter acanthamoebae]
MIKLYTIGLSVMLALSTSAHSEIFKPKTAKLDNGLEIVLIENHLAPVVSIALTYKIGTADDPSDMIGLSHFLEHLMFKGTKKVPAGEFKERIISKGGMINAYTTPDVTVYTCDIAVEHLDMVLEIEADRMSNIVFDEKETQAEQKVVMEERRMRLDNNPLGAAYETILRALFKYHPYGIPTIGYPQHIAAYTNEAAKDHYNKWYTPNNAVLIISGDITIDKLLPMVKKHFGGTPARPLPAHMRLKDPVDKGVVQKIFIKSPRISFVNFDWYYRAPNHQSEQRSHYYPLIVLSQILGGNANSRLYKELVDKKGIALEANAHYEDESIDPKHFEITATLHPAHKPEELKAAVEEQLKLLVDKGVTELELKTAQRDLLAGLAFARDGNSGAINAFKRLAFGFSVNEVESYPDKIRAVTVEQVDAAIKDILGTELAVYSEVHPAR